MVTTTGVATGLPGAAPRPDGAAAGLTGLRVLVVEDEFFIADDLANALRSQGVEVVGPVSRLREALDVISANEPLDFAIVDVNLDGDAAFAVGDALIARDIAFMFATGYERDFLPARFQSVPYWEKPFDPRALARALAGRA